MIKTMALPVGMFSEQASESCNKLYKENRKYSSPKVSRTETTRSVFLRSLESSDPIISSFRLSNRQKKLRKMPIPDEALKLLKPVVFQDDQVLIPDLEDDESFSDDLHSAELNFDDILMSDEDDDDDEDSEESGSDNDV